MRQQLNLEEIMRKNPQIDRKEFEELCESNKGLQTLGIKRKDYDLAPAFGGRRLSTRKDLIEKSFVVRRRPD